MLHQALTKNAPEQYYFQIAPNLLTVRTGKVIRALKAKQTTFKFKLFKEKQLVDETRKPFVGTPINGKIPIQKVQLNFFIPQHYHNQSAQYTIALYQLEEGSQAQNQVGTCIILSGQYINEYREHRIRRVSESVDIGSDFTVNFDIFLNTTRNALEKFIKETREQNNQNARNDMINNSGDYRDNVPRLSQARSEKNSKSSRGEIIRRQSRFVSPPGRKIDRKNVNQKKLLVRSNSPVRSQKSGGSQGSRKNRDLKFLSGRDGGVSPKRGRQSLAQQEVQKIENQKSAEKEKIVERPQPNIQENKKQEKKSEIEEKPEPKVQENKKQPEVEEQTPEQTQPKEEQAHPKEVQAQEDIQQKKIVEQLLNKDEQRKKQDEAQEEERKKQIERLKEESQKEEQANKEDNADNSRQIQKKSAHNSAHSKPTSIHKPPKKADQQDILMDSSNQGSKKQKKVEWQKPIQIKRTNSFTSGEKSGFQKQSFGQKKQQMQTGTLIKYIIFMIVSFLLILHAMTPSSKV